MEDVANREKPSALFSSLFLWNYHPVAVWTQQPHWSPQQQLGSQSPSLYLLLRAARSSGSLPSSPAKRTLIGCNIQGNLGVRLKSLSAESRQDGWVRFEWRNPSVAAAVHVQGVLLETGNYLGPVSGGEAAFVLILWCRKHIGKQLLSVWQQTERYAKRHTETVTFQKLDDNLSATGHRVCVAERVFENNNLQAHYLFRGVCESHGSVQTEFLSWRFSSLQTQEGNKMGVNVTGSFVTITVNLSTFWLQCLRICGSVG